MHCIRVRRIDTCIQQLRTRMQFAARLQDNSKVRGIFQLAFASPFQEVRSCELSEPQDLSSQR